MTEDIIARIDEALDCQREGCTKPIREGGPSRDFCSEECQRTWWAKRAVPLSGLKEDRAALLDPPSAPELVVEIEVDTSTWDRQMGFLAQWFRRAR